MVRVTLGSRVGWCGCSEETVEWWGRWVCGRVLGGVGVVRGWLQAWRGDGGSGAGGVGWGG